MWYHDNEPRWLNVKLTLNDGDIYCMSEKTVGTDWRPNIDLGFKSKSYTLRHAAGAQSYTTKTTKINIKNFRPSSNIPDDVFVGDIYFKPKASIKNKNPEWTLMQLMITIRLVYLILLQLLLHFCLLLVRISQLFVQIF